MRDLRLLALLGFVLMSACGGSTSGTSGGTATGGLGSTGGNTTSGGSSSGGSTSYREVGPGGPCMRDDDCVFGVCGIDGTGRCCAAACATSDVTCGATGCDGRGDCLYPGSASLCGGDSCNGHTLTRSACNGAGACAFGNAPCAGNLTCRDATSCATQCATSADCVSGFYCDSTTHGCLAQYATGACTSDNACTSGVCGVAGSGACCAARCPAATDARCDATGCDATSGACLPPTTCGTPSCTGNSLTSGTCTANGTCNVGTRTCPNNLVCDSTGRACLLSCVGAADCLSGFYCSGTGCLPQLGAGFFCNADAACTSGVCGVGGFGHCCLNACDTSDPICGAKDCDSSGYCSFPGDQTSCGAAESCSGTTYTAAPVCNWGGGCSAPGPADCAPYVCGASTCLKTCTDDSSCSTGSFCDIGAQACCTLASGGTIAVDGATGKDTTACCGIGGNGACQTLTRAMALIDAAQAQNVTINATLNGAGGDWTANETYPVVLGWGVELSAPGVFFADLMGPNGTNHAEIFDINFYSANDTVGYASLVGSATAAVGVGMDSAGNQTDDAAVIWVDDENTLYIANASVNGSMSNPDANWTFNINDGATLMLGQDQSGGITGTVQIGNALGQKATDGKIGIVCGNSTIEDAPLVGQSSVIIQGQETGDILIFGSATVSLRSNPVLGVPPAAQGFKQCPQKSDGIGVELSSAGCTVTIKNGIVQCIGGRGFDLESGTLTIDNTLIQNADTGIYAQNGTATVTNSTLQFNYVGVMQQAYGSIDLSGGGNTVVCSSNVESFQGSTAPGICVSNGGIIGGLNASNVAWDTSGPDYFDCTDPTACTCLLSSCTVTPGADGMDAVEASSFNAITTTGNTLSPISCN